MSTSIKRELLSTKAFLRNFKKLEKKIKIDIEFKSEKLCLDPFHQDLNIKKLKGYLDNYRVVIINNYRLIYTFNESQITLLDVKHRKDIYKNR